MEEIRQIIKPLVAVPSLTGRSGTTGTYTYVNLKTRSRASLG
jgi:hypothetical protein